jgi:hypothetical protein
VTLCWQEPRGACDVGAALCYDPVGRSPLLRVDPCRQSFDAPLPSRRRSLSLAGLRPFLCARILLILRVTGKHWPPNAETRGQKFGLREDFGPNAEARGHNLMCLSVGPSARPSGLVPQRWAENPDQTWQK